MGGGILQLVAKSMEDIYITNDPEITYFKTVYRRHTNFSKVERYINRNHKMNFGSEFTCKIKKYGDLLHKMSLIIDLPRITMAYPVLTKAEVKTTLASYSITWSYTGNPTDPVTEDEYTDEILPLIQAKIVDLTSKNTLLDTYIEKLELFKDEVSGVTYSSHDILEFYFYQMMIGNTYEVQYNYFKNYFADENYEYTYLNLTYFADPKTSDKLQVFIYQSFIKEIIQKYEENIIRSVCGTLPPENDYIYLNTDESAIDDYYNGWTIKLDGQIRTISDYDGASRKATLSVAWTTTPTTFKYTLYNASIGGYLSNITFDAGIYYISLDTITDQTAHYYDNWIIRFNSVISRILYSNNVDFDTSIERTSYIPYTGDKYTLYYTPIVYYITNTVASATTYTATLNGTLSSVDDAYTGWYIKFPDTAFSSYVFQILAYEGSTSTVTVNKFYTTTPTGTYILFREMLPEYIHQVIGYGRDKDTGDTIRPDVGLFLSGTVASASSTTITFDTNVPTNEGALGTSFKVVVGSETKNISSYNYVSKTATIDGTWTTVPTSSDQYMVYYTSDDFTLDIPAIGTTNVQFVLKDRYFLNEAYDLGSEFVFKANQNLSKIVNYYKGWILFYAPVRTVVRNIDNVYAFVTTYDSTEVETYPIIKATPLKKYAYYSTAIDVGIEEDYLIDYSQELNFLIYAFIQLSNFTNVPINYVGSSVKDFIQFIIESSMNYYDDKYTSILSNTDAYKIMDDYIIDTLNYTISSSNVDLSTLTTELNEQIYWNLTKNLQQLYTILNVIENNRKPTDATVDPHFRLTFYKFCEYTTNYSMSGLFINASTLSLDNDDNFTNTFTISKDPYESDGIIHYYGNYVYNSVQSFHSTNTNLINSTTFSGYFGESYLWIRDDLNYYKEFDNTDATFKYLCIMNTIPNAVCTDVPLITNEELNNYLSYKYPTVDVTALLSDYLTVMNAEKTILQTAVKSYLALSSSDKTYIQEIISYSGKTEIDLLITFIFRPEATFGLSNKLPLEYILSEFTTVSDAFFDDTAVHIAYPAITNWEYIKSLMYSIIRSFDGTSTAFPSYQTYVGNKYRVMRDRFDLSGTVGTVYCDAQSCIYNILLLQYISYYDGLFNNTILNDSYYYNSIGLDMYVTRHMVYDILENDFDNGGETSFYSFTSTKYNLAKTLINYRINSYETAYENIDNKNLMAVNNILLNRPNYFINTTTNIYNEIKSIMSTDEETYYPSYFYNGAFYYDTDLVNEYLEFINNQFNLFGYGIMNKISGGTGGRGANQDMFYEFRTNVDYIEPDVNPYSEILVQESNRYSWYDTYILDKTETEKDLMITNFNTLFDAISKTSLYSDYKNICSLYNLFYKKSDMDRYFGDYIIKKFVTYGDIFSYLTSDWTETYSNLMTYYEATKSSNTTNITSLTALITSLYEEIYRTTPSFAWIKHIGYFIIDRIELEIDGQRINSHTGEWLYINHVINDSVDQSRGIDIMTGNVDELTTFNNTEKSTYRLYIPLQFWFCKSTGLSLPLVALQHANINVTVKIKPLEQIAYWSDDGYFTKTPKITCMFAGDFIYLESDERNLFAKSKLEYIIEDVRYNGDFIMSYEHLDEDNELREYINFNNSCKQIFWFAQPICNIDGTLTNGELQPYNFIYQYTQSAGTQGKITEYVKLYDDTSVALTKKINVIHNYTDPPTDDFPLYFSYSTETLTNTIEVNPIYSSRIKFNGSEREPLKVEPYYSGSSIFKRQGATPDGVLSYSFALNPSESQPSGSANLGTLAEVAIHIKINEDVITQMTSSYFKVKFGIYCVLINILRVMSGLAGLAFE